MSTLEFYNANAEKYAAATSLDILGPHLEQFCTSLTSGAHILDLGSGSGHCAKWMIDHGFSVSMIDASTGLAKEAEKLTGQTVQVMGFEDLDYIDEFDAIWASASLHHARADSLPQILQKTTQALRPAGRLYASFKDLKSDLTDTFGRFFSAMNETQLIELLENSGFSINHIDTFQDIGRDGLEMGWLCAFATTSEQADCT